MHKALFLLSWQSQKWNKLNENCSLGVVIITVVCTVYWNRKSNFFSIPSAALHTHTQLCLSRRTHSSDALPRSPFDRKVVRVHSICSSCQEHQHLPMRTVVQYHFPFLFRIREPASSSNHCCCHCPFLFWYSAWYVGILDAFCFIRLDSFLSIV